MLNQCKKLFPIFATKCISLSNSKEEIVKEFLIT